MIQRTSLGLPVKMTAKGFPSDLPRSGIGSYYCYMADFELALRIASRRFYCGCKGCEERLSRQIAERYTGPWKECKFWEVFKIDEERGWNDVSILEFEPGKGCDEEELKDTLAVSLNDLGHQLALSIVEGGYGAYSVDGKLDYYIVKWAGTPRQVEKDEVIRVDRKDVQLFAGEWVCDGIWLNHVPRAKNWYFVGNKKVTVRLKGLLHADLDMMPISADNPLPRINRRVKEQVLPLNPIKVSDYDHDYMMDEAHRREDFDFEEDFVMDDDESDDDSGSVASEEDLRDCISSDEDDISSDEEDAEE